jgi:8-oxo-dGTP pyrophosphatase MutT (NUDIX family)
LDKDSLLESDKSLREVSRASATAAAQRPIRRGVVAVVLRGEQFLVIRRSQTVRAPGMHCFPGGTIEAGESEPDAVRREMCEELALEAQPRRLLWRSTTAWGVELAWWLTEIETAVKPVANPLEVESFHWLSAPEIRALAELLASNVEFLDAWEAGKIER